MKSTNPTNSILVIATIMYLCLSISAVCQQSSDSLSYYRDLVNSPQNGEQLVKSFRFFEQHQRNARLINDTGAVAHDEFQLARIHYKGGFFNDSETLAINALKLLDKLPEDSFTKGLRKSIYNHLGMLYRKQNNRVKALELYTRTLAFSETTFDSVIVYNNQSNAYKDFKFYNQAKKELFKAYELLPKIQDSLTKAMVIDNMGYLNLQLGDTTALDFLNRALHLRLHAEDTTKAYSSYANLAEYYKDKDSTKSMNYALKAYSISQMFNNSRYKEDALGMLATLDPKRYFTSYKALRDSMAVTQQLMQNRFAALKYDASKSELQAEKEKTKRIRYQTIFFTLAVLGVFLVILMRTRTKRQRLLQVYNTETRISKKVHDEIANDIYQVMTRIQTTSKSTEELLDDLEIIYIKTRDISKENTTIDISQNFGNLLQDLLLGYKSKDVNIMTHNSDKVNWQKVSINKKHAIYRVLQELMTNMKKHSKATHTVISFNQNAAKVQIAYKDNGQGCDLRKQTGLQNAENRIKAVGGNITFDSQPKKGFQVTLSV